MRTKIYQINNDRDVNSFKFLCSAELERVQGTPVINASLYDKVFDGDIPETDPEAIFVKFNCNIPPTFKGHAMSVSDVLVIDNGALYCDLIGFKQIDFDESKTEQ